MKNSTIKLWIFAIVAIFSYLIIAILNEMAGFDLDWYEPILVGVGLGILAVIFSND